MKMYRPEQWQEQYVAKAIGLATTNISDKIHELEKELKRLQDAKAEADLEINRAKAVKNILKENPNFTAKTKMIADWILEKYPNLSKCTTLDLTIPFLFNIAYKIEVLLDFEIPEEFK